MQKIILALLIGATLLPGIAQASKVKGEALYLRQYQYVQEKIETLRSTSKLSERQQTKSKCLSVQTGPTQARCMNLIGQQQATAAYILEIQGNFLQPVSELSVKYQKKLDSTSQEIYNLKVDYYNKVEAIRSDPVSARVMEARIQTLTTLTNSKIEALSEKKQSTYVEYQTKTAR